ncbi:MULTISPECIES: hypothetical protein [Acinetobacter]|jgi:hypothetical protein|uniref:Response receiver domain-containing protein n=1 Tax=Acinetobacter pittii TaxID=48296 RepID=A0A242U4H6_ACIPI|nr:MULTISPECIES: hypothetical protein [Acinetobacter]MBJ8501665.1 hypothetical protein [Acinetobacter pittii]MBJ9892098.1 hypothetical protein [Acinetobacter pittii]MCU4479179.1 hypothetical protein [Acinetobacter sp. WU_MDCI_Abxd143]OTU27747.1 hypothetical protein CAT59_08865 [Acinetobacter pittii]
MLTPPRFVVLDDKKEHLEPIVETFKLIGSSCIGVQYNEEDASHLHQDYYKGVRGLFIDLNLSGNSSLGSSTHYAEITRILETVISCDNGPFIMILWTDNPQECDQLIEYIETRLDPNKKYCKPLLIKSLSKTMYIDANSSIKESNRETFKEEIKSFFSSVPQIAALFDWESRVLEAVNQTLIELLNLVPNDKRTFNDYPAEIDKVLSCITSSTLGDGHVNKDRQQAFNISTAPILTDKILNNKNFNQGIWENAITKVNTPDSKITDPKAVGKYNKMLHLAVTGHEKMSPLDWGAVLRPIYWCNEMTCDLFGLTIEQIKTDVFGIKPEKSSSYEPIFIRLGAVCDYAQQKEGLIPYYLGYKISRTDFVKRKNEFEWHSPLFFTDAETEPFYLVINLKYLLTLHSQKTSIFEVKYRIREQLLNQLILRASNHASRPGINELYVR